MVSGMIQIALHFIVPFVSIIIFISSTSDHQAADSGLNPY